MSDEEEEQATLAAALALVDADSDDRDCAAPAAACSPQSPALSTSELQPVRARSCQRDRRDRKRTRVELLQLREQAGDLEAHLAQLKRFYTGGNGHRQTSAIEEPRCAPHGSQACRGRGGAAKATVPPSGWSSRAVAEYERLIESKKRNRELKAALDEQLRANATLGKLFELQLSEQDLELLSEVEKQNDPFQIRAEADDAGDATADSSNYNPSMSAMLLHLENMRARTDEMLAQVRARNTRCVFSTVHAQHDSELGVSHELSTNTPLARDYNELERALWRQISVDANVECRKPRHQLRNIPQVKKHFSGCHPSQMSITFSENLGGRTMNGEFVIRKIFEPSRVVFVLTARLSFVDSALVIREDAWIVLSDASPDDTSSGNVTLSPASNKMVLQSHYRIHTESRDPEMSREIEHLQDFVVRFQSKKMKAHQLHMQQALLRDRNTMNSNAMLSELRFSCVACSFDGSRLQSHLQANAVATACS